MSQQIRTFLMFQGGTAEAALTRYAEVIPGAEIRSLARYGADGPAPEGTVFRAILALGGQEIQATDSFVDHAFDFTPSISLFVDCESADEVDQLAAALGEGGGELMPPGDYGFSQRFAWSRTRGASPGS
jgi:predicted 3-demethylubiquinone-9 3-methyltransferase (glyoxalase superfamily)